jgi:hypothetical protein
MAIDDHLAGRVRAILAGAGAVEEKKMFGGLTFMLDRHMCCGVLGDQLMVRVGPALEATALAEPHARPCDITGRPMKGLVMVAPAGHGSEAALAKLVGLAVEFVTSLPPK